MHLFSAGFIIVVVSLQVRQLQPESSLRERGCNTLSPCPPVLESRHWLPVCQRIDFRSSSLVYKAQKGFGPKYISNFLVQGEHPDRSGPQEEVYSWIQESQAAFSYYTILIKALYYIVFLGVPFVFSSVTLVFYAMHCKAQWTALFLNSAAEIKLLKNCFVWNVCATEQHLVHGLSWNYILYNFISIHICN